jgi:hypothetical protein
MSNHNDLIRRGDALMAILSSAPNADAHAYAAVAALPTAPAPDPHAIARAALEKAAEKAHVKLVSLRKYQEAQAVRDSILSMAKKPAALAEIVGRVKG